MNLCMYCSPLTLCGLFEIIAVVKMPQPTARLCVCSIVTFTARTILCIRVIILVIFSFFFSPLFSSFPLVIRPTTVSLWAYFLRDTWVCSRSEGRCVYVWVNIRCSDRFIDKKEQPLPNLLKPGDESVGACKFPLGAEREIKPALAAYVPSSSCVFLSVRTEAVLTLQHTDARRSRLWIHVSDSRFLRTSLQFAGESCFFPRYTERRKEPWEILLLMKRCNVNWLDN